MKNQVSFTSCIEQEVTLSFYPPGEAVERYRGDIVNVFDRLIGFRQTGGDRVLWFPLDRVVLYTTPVWGVDSSTPSPPGRKGPTP